MKLITRGFAVVTICTIGFGTIYVVLQPHKVDSLPYFADDRFQIIAHRGGLGLRPENTILAFQNADSLNVDVLEMDIHSSADGELVVIHDDTVDRTTNGVGRVSEINFKQLRQLDAAFNWQNNYGEIPYRGKGIRIPSLSEILKKFSHRRLLLEIKSNDVLTGEKICHSLRQYKMQDKTVVGSFHSKALNAFSLHCPKVPTSASSIHVGTFLLLHYLRLGFLYPNPPSAFQVPEHLGRLRLVDSRFIKQIQSLNSVVHVWTVNQPETMKKLIDLGVNGIITDYPDRLSQLLKRNNGTNTQ
tara:strand:+ start:5469 stop:6368 length:900 start_codon:yes stop_codon:yes gene_type:complete